MNPKLNLDKLDLQIIQEMMEDAEVSYAYLGNKIFVSGGTIQVRIKKLDELGVVKGKKLSVDLKELGYDVIAFIGIYLEKSSLYDSVAKELKKVPEIVRLNYTTGNYSMFAEIGEGIAWRQYFTIGIQGYASISNDKCVVRAVKLL